MHDHISHHPDLREAFRCAEEFRRQYPQESLSCHIFSECGYLLTPVDILAARQFLSQITSRGMIGLSQLELIGRTRSETDLANAEQLFTRTFQRQELRDMMCALRAIRLALLGNRREANKECQRISEKVIQVNILALIARFLQHPKDLADLQAMLRKAKIKSQNDPKFLSQHAMFRRLVAYAQLKHDAPTARFSVHTENFELARKDGESTIVLEELLGRIAKAGNPELALMLSKKHHVPLDMNEETHKASFAMGYAQIGQVEKARELGESLQSLALRAPVFTTFYVAALEKYQR